MVDHLLGRRLLRMIPMREGGIVRRGGGGGGGRDAL